jgi:AhpD family alkylhydroperoxidase
MPRTPIEYRNASGEVRAVFDDIKRTRQVEDVNNFWKYLAHDPALLKRTWASIKEVMAPGALDPLTKEMIYLAVSVSNGCGYCIASHSAAARKAGNERSDVRRIDGRRRHGQRDQSAVGWLSRADRSGIRMSGRMAIGEGYQLTGCNLRVPNCALAVRKKEAPAQAPGLNSDLLPLMRAVVRRRSDRRRGICRRRS